MKMVELKADGGHYLTDGVRKVLIITVPAEEVSNWEEELLDTSK